MKTRAILASGLMACGAALPGFGQEAAPDMAERTSVEAGATAYAEACAACHGAGGAGDGPMAAMLTVAVPDLTRLAARNGGSYDPVRVIQMVDGEQGLAAHGGPMPMFGGLLTGPTVAVDGPDGSAVSTSAPILAIARWLETRQEGN